MGLLDWRGSLLEFLKDTDLLNLSVRDLRLAYNLINRGLVLRRALQVVDPESYSDLDDCVVNEQEEIIKGYGFLNTINQLSLIYYESSTLEEAAEKISAAENIVLATNNFNKATEEADKELSDPSRVVDLPW